MDSVTHPLHPLHRVWVGVVEQVKKRVSMGLSVRGRPQSRLGKRVEREIVSSLSDLLRVDSARVSLKAMGINQVGPWLISLVAHAEDLVLAGNPLGRGRGIHPKFASLVFLTRLSLNSCGLTSLPDVFATMARLEWLYLGRNHLQTLPPSIGSAARLRGLQLGGNAFARLPPWMVEMDSIIALDLSFNALASLPLELGGMKNLRELSLQGNPLSGPELELATAYGPAELVQVLNTRRTHQAQEDQGETQMHTLVDAETQMTQSGSAVDAETQADALVDAETQMTQSGSAVDAETQTTPHPTLPPEEVGSEMEDVLRRQLSTIWEENEMLKGKNPPRESETERVLRELVSALRAENALLRGENPDDRVGGVADKGCQVQRCNCFTAVEAYVPGPDCGLRQSQRDILAPPKLHQVEKVDAWSMTASAAAPEAHDLEAMSVDDLRLLTQALEDEKRRVSDTMHVVKEYFDGASAALLAQEERERESAIEVQESVNTLLEMIDNLQTPHHIAQTAEISFSTEHLEGAARLLSDKLQAFCTQVLDSNVQEPSSPHSPHSPHLPGAPHVAAGPKLGPSASELDMIASLHLSNADLGLDPILEDGEVSWSASSSTSSSHSSSHSSSDGEETEESSSRWGVSPDPRNAPVSLDDADDSMLLAASSLFDSINVLLEKKRIRPMVEPNAYLRGIRAERRSSMASIPAHLLRSRGAERRGRKMSMPHLFPDQVAASEARAISRSATANTLGSSAPILDSSLEIARQMEEAADAAFASTDTDDGTDDGTDDPQ